MFGRVSDDDDGGARVSLAYENFRRRRGTRGRVIGFFGGGGDGDCELDDVVVVVVRDLLNYD